LSFLLIKLFVIIAVNTHTLLYGDKGMGINGVYGTKALARCFRNAFDFKHRAYQSGGKLSQWMQDHTEAAVLVELPSRPSREGYVDKNAQKLIQALNEWFSRDV